MDLGRSFIQGGPEYKQQFHMFNSMGTCEGRSGNCVCFSRVVPKMVAHNGLYTPQ